MQRNAAQHAARSVVSYIDIFVAGSVAARFERRYDVSKLLLKRILSAEHKPSDRRMQTVGADHQIEASFGAMFEFDQHVVGEFLHGNNFIAENDFRRVFDLLEQQL